MKICIISDSHDRRDYMRSAVESAKSNGAEAVFHCGDLVSPSTLRALTDLDLPIHLIHGNNTGDLYALTRLASLPQNHITYYGQDATMNLAERKIFLVHYPHYAHAMATTGDWDLVCCGHDHHAVIKEIDNIKGGKTMLVNPGSVGGVAVEPTFIMGDLATMKFELHLVE